jgi:Ca-activated chloride channel family protein
MYFRNPIFLYLLLLVLPGMAAFMFFSLRRREKFISSLGDKEMIEGLMPRSRKKYLRFSFLLNLISLLLIFISLSGPQFGSRMVEVKRRGVDIIIAVDCSTSMLAEDVKPNRMSKVKMELSRFIDALKGDRIGIIAFAGTAFLQCPLTLDYGAAKMLLNLLSPELLPIQGTSLSSAISLAVKSFVQKERKYKVLILLTDGEDHSPDTMDAVEEAKREGVKIFCIGVGRPEGEVIPVRDSQGNLIDYKRDRSGQVVVSRLDEQLLQRIALATGGKYYPATEGEIEVEQIYSEISSMEKKELQSRFREQYEDRFQIPLFLGIITLSILYILKEA